METTSQVLHDHMLRPRHYGPLPLGNGRGVATGDGGRLAVDVQIDNDQVCEVGFEVWGDDVLLGCSSFVLDCLRGQSLAWAGCLRTYVFQWALHLHKDDSRVDTVVRAVHAAIADYRRKNPRQVDQAHFGQPGAPRGHRKSTPLPRPTRRELALLRPGETYQQLMEERMQILGVLENLADCRSIETAAHVFSQDVNSGQREELLCLTVDVLQALSTLADEDRRLVQFIGYEGMSGVEAAASMNVSQTTIHARLRTIAYKISKYFRRAH